MRFEIVELRAAMESTALIAPAGRSGRLRAVADSTGRHLRCRAALLAAWTPGSPDATIRARALGVEHARPDPVTILACRGALVRANPGGVSLS